MFILLQNHTILRNKEDNHYYTTLAAPLVASLSSFSNDNTKENNRKSAPVINKSPLILNVKDYGATGDGTTNDTAQIKTCLFFQIG